MDSFPSRLGGLAPYPIAIALWSLCLLKWRHSLLRLCVMPQIVHSLFTFSSPRNRNRRSPRAYLV
jgi:hypothetical protein